MDDPPEQAPEVVYTYSPAAGGRTAFECRLEASPVSLALTILFQNVFSVMAAWIVADALWVALELDGAERDALGSVMVIGAWTVGSWLERRRAWTVETKRLEDRYRVIGPITVSLGEDALVVATRMSSTRVDWNGVHRIEIRERHVVFGYLRAENGLAIPFGAFRDEAAARAFRDAAERLKRGAVRSATDE